MGYGYLTSTNVPWDLNCNDCVLLAPILSEKGVANHTRLYNKISWVAQISSQLVSGLCPTYRITEM